MKPPEPARAVAPMRIVHYCPAIKLELGGVARSALDWCGLLARRGHDVTLVTYHAPDVPSDWTGAAGKPRVVWLPPSPTPNWLVSRKAMAIWRETLSTQCIVHLHTPWMGSNIQMSRAARRLGIPYIVSLHGMLCDWPMSQKRLKKTTFLRLGGDRYLRWATRLHYTAAAERDQAAKWVPGSRSTVLPCLVDLEPFQNLPGPGPAHAKFAQALAGDDPKLLFLSRLHEKKGLDILIDAADLLRKAGRKFKLLIAGTGRAEYEQLLRGQVARLKLDNEIIFLGHVGGVEKVSLFQSADLFVLPTHHENFGLVLVEAMAAGTPVVTTRGADIWQELQSAGAGITENDPQSLAAAIGAMLDRRSELAALGERGRAWVMRDLNSDTVAAGYEAMYRDALAG
jgi:glycosyltransferase involved in cell wall biosynthesis